jgi:hypothetical protein
VQARYNKLGESVVFDFHSSPAVDVVEEGVLQRLLGCDPAFRQVGQHLQQQIDEIVAVLHRFEELFQVDPLEGGEGVEQTGVEWHSALVLFHFLR